MNENIIFKNGDWLSPDNPRIGFIIGDGIGIDVTPVASITNLDVFLKGCFVLLSVP